MASRSDAAPSRLIAEIGEAERLERVRLADALHDGVLQWALAARQDLMEIRDGDASLLDSLQESLDEIAAELRALTSAMHEDVLEQLQLDEALRRIADGVRRRGRFTVRIEVDPAARGIHDALVRDAVRELLANVARHARADTTHVDVALDEDCLVVRVADDGRGIDTRTVALAEREGHVGLGRLRRIAQELGGSLALEGLEGAGTTVTLRLPRVAVAAQRSVEEQLRTERRWSAALVAALQDGLVVTRDRLVVQVNDAFCAMTGFTRDELVGKSALDHPIWPPDERERLLAEAQRSLDTGGVEAVMTLQRVDGSRFPALVSTARVDDGSGGDVGLLVMVKDLSERHREEERRRLETELTTAIQTTRRLTTLLAAVPHGRDAVLTALGALLASHLGWGDVVVNLRDDGGCWRVAWTSGPELAEALAGATYTDEDWARVLQPEALRHGAYFLVEGSAEPPGAVHVPDVPATDDPDAWRAGDMLLVPMRDARGELGGLVSVDRPASGRRPTETELEVLGAVVQNAERALHLVRS